MHALFDEFRYLFARVANYGTKVIYIYIYMTIQYGGYNLLYPFLHVTLYIYVNYWYVRLAFLNKNMM
jgi:hypothetical protein